MPKEITHLILSEAIFERSPFLPKGQKYRAAFNLGALTPDILYYDVPWPGHKHRHTSAALAEIIHGKNGEENTRHIFWMIDEARHIQSKGDLESSLLLMSFIVGFLSHMAADTLFHPLVYSLSGNYYDDDPERRTDAKAAHRLFESCMDVHFLESKGTPQCFHPHAVLPKKDFSFLMTCFASSLMQCYAPKEDVHGLVHRSVVKARIMELLFRQRWLFYATHFGNKACKGKLRTFHNLFFPGKKASSKVLFHRLGQVAHPVTGKPYPGDVNLLFDKTLERGLEFAETAIQYMQKKRSLDSARKRIPPYSYNNGMVATPTSQMVHYSRLSGLERW